MRETSSPPLFAVADEQCDYHEGDHESQSHVPVCEHVSLGWRTFMPPSPWVFSAAPPLVLVPLLRRSTAHERHCRARLFCRFPKRQRGHISSTSESCRWKHGNLHAVFSIIGLKGRLLVVAAGAGCVRDKTKPSKGYQWCANERQSSGVVQNSSTGTPPQKPRPIWAFGPLRLLK